MGPCVHGDIALEIAESSREQGSVVQDVDSDHEMRRALVIRFQEIVQLG